jgi:putative transposase
MPRGPRIKSISGIYHVMLRGANRQEIFHDDIDCMRFLEMIEKYKKMSGMKVYAWCLMNNHVHLLLKEGIEGLSITMKRIGVSYVWYYNLKYNTTGHLFQDRFRTENVESNVNLFRVIRYIHQNPVKAGIVKRSDEWKWSSCAGYYGKNSHPSNLLDVDFILKKLSTDITNAKQLFKEFNERRNNDQYLEDAVGGKRLSDDEARLEIKELLGPIEIAQVKSLPREKRNEVLRKVRCTKGLSLRQAARILGVSHNLIFKA